MTRSDGPTSGCPCCGSDDHLAFQLDNWRDSRIPVDVPSAARVFCKSCGTCGPWYRLPIVWLKTDPPPTWDPRERAVAAWDGDVNPDGLEVDDGYHTEDC